MSDDEVQTITLYDADAPTNRKCGTCTLCCRLLPVLALNKPDNTRCRHQRHGKGCMVYRKAGFPMECGLWSCRWLTMSPHTEHMKRPDRCHYAIDPLPDMIRITSNSTGEVTDLMALQVWVDPAYRGIADKDPELLDYMKYVAEEFHWPTMVRFSARDGYAVFPPPTSGDGEWLIKGSEVNEALGTYAALTRMGLRPPTKT